MEDRVKAIEFALNNEKQERDFYLKHSRRSNNRLGKEMFATIAEEEEEHYQFLKELHQKLQKQGKWPEEISAVIKDTNVTKVLEGLVDKLSKNDSVTADDKEAIMIALDFEKKAYTFYSNLAQQATHPNEKTIFNQLAALESSHIASLVRAQQYFENPADFFRDMEHTNWEG